MSERNVRWLNAIENQDKKTGKAPDFLAVENVANVMRIHTTLESYEPTPLVSLKGLAKKLGVKAVFVKDESRRFGLKAFKGLGGSYALTRVICRELGLDIETVKFSDLKAPELQEKIRRMVFITTTDGNHGKGVSWAAGLLGCEAHVYMPRGSSELRAQAIRDVGKAYVEITDMNYDDTVRYTARLARENGWYLVQDTSWPGYEEIPSWIVQGYTTMAAEAAMQLQEAGYDRPSHVFLQAGVGAMAGGVLGYLANRYEDCRPVFGIAEPENVACIYRSAQVSDGDPHAATGSGVTIMAGLNCGEPCTITWPILRDFADWYFSCPDYVSAYGMRILGCPLEGDTRVTSGESGAVTTGLLALLTGKEECSELREKLGLDENAVVLLFNTEGDTDPVQYERFVWGGQLPLPENL